MYGNRGRSLSQRLDDLATGSGLYAITMINRPEPRNLRVLPALILVGMVIGYALTCIGLSGLHRETFGLQFAVGIGGAVLFFGGFIGANWVRFAGPRIVPSVSAALDEREVMLKAKAGSVSGLIITVLVIGGCFYCGSAQYSDWWVPHRTTDWIYLGLLIEGWAFTLPVLVASWLQPADVEDEF
jgi:hypothetical protein